MSALNPVLLNAEFWLLWSVRQLLRGIAIGIGLTSGVATLALFGMAGALGSALETLQEHPRVTGFFPNTTQLATSARGHKELLS